MTSVLDGSAEASISRSMIPDDPNAVTIDPLTGEPFKSAVAFIPNAPRPARPMPEAWGWDDVRRFFGFAPVAKKCGWC